MESYRVEWSVADETGEETNRIATKEYGDNKSAAMAFARRQSGEPMKPGIVSYVIKSVDDVEVGQWAYGSGFTDGFTN